MGLAAGAGGGRWLAMSLPEVDGLDLGVVLDLLGRALLEDAPVVHHRHMERDAQSDVEIVLDEYIAYGRGEGIENPNEIAPLRRREARRGLVGILNALPAYIGYIVIEHDLDVALRVSSHVTMM